MCALYQIRHNDYIKDINSAIWSAKSQKLSIHHGTLGPVRCDSRVCVGIWSDCILWVWTWFPVTISSLAEPMGISNFTIFYDFLIARNATLWPVNILWCRVTGWCPLILRSSLGFSSRQATTTLSSGAKWSIDRSFFITGRKHQKTLIVILWIWFKSKKFQFLAPGEDKLAHPWWVFPLSNRNRMVL